MKVLTTAELKRIEKGIKDKDFGIMHFQAKKVKNFHLIPIGNIRFSFNKRKGCILSSDVCVYHDTKMTLEIEDCKALLKAMKLAKTLSI